MNSNLAGKNAQALGIFSLIMITVGAVDSIRNLPTAALFGSALIFFFFFAALLFLLPSALVVGELAATWPEHGGVYIWVSKAFGKRMGFLAIWLQWVEDIIWFPTILSFIGATIGYLISPEMATNKYFLAGIIIISFWSTTLVNLFGIRWSALFSNICTIAGLLLPILIIIVLGTTWIASGNPVQIHLTLKNIWPNFDNPQMWISLTGIIMSYCGMEIATVHAGNVHNPQRNFPRSLIISAVILLASLTLGSLMIAMVLPESNISLVAGVMQAFDAFFKAYHLHWIMPIIAIMLVLGSLGGVNSWILAPARGMWIAAHNGHLPYHFRRANRSEAPSIILIYQAIIVTLLVSVFIFMPSVNGSYWLLTALAAQLYMLMYIIVFAAGIYLRYKHPHKHRPFKIPGGKFGMWFWGILGITAALTTFIVSFISPHNINIGTNSHYHELLLGGLILMIAPALIGCWRYKEVRALADAMDK